MAADGRRAAGETWFTPAQCAKRTGLTIRALRLYERYELLAAKRMQNGWRYYGIEELERLNTITVLKTVGMTLAQIRDLLRAKQPSLERVLEVQVRAWKAKKMDAERGLLLAQIALKRVQGEQVLSVDALSRLIHAMEVTDHGALMHTLLNEALTPQEYAAAVQFMQRNFDLGQVKEQLQAEAAIFKRIRQLMEGGAAPESGDVQRLLMERNQIALRYGGSARALKMLQWNPTIGVKFFAIEARTLRKMRSQPQADQDPRVIVTPQVWDFVMAAGRKAPWTEPVMSIIADAGELLGRNPDPASDEARSLVQRYRDIYTKYSVDDPDVSAQLVRYWEALHDGWPQWAGEESRAAWLFLSEAVIHDCNEVAAVPEAARHS